MHRTEFNAGDRVLAYDRDDAGEVLEFDIDWEGAGIAYVLWSDGTKTWESLGSLAHANA